MVAIFDVEKWSDQCRILIYKQFNPEKQISRVKLSRVRSNNEFELYSTAWLW